MCLNFATMKGLFVYLIAATVGSISTVSCQDLPIIYNVTATKGCPTTHIQRDNIVQDIKMLLTNSVLPSLNHTTIGPGHGACGCSGPGWRRAVYLNMSDPTQTCPSAWELIATPRRSCRRSSNTNERSCYSAIFPTQGIQYSQVCGRIIGYQFGAPQAFRYVNEGNPQTIDDPYVDGVSLTYGSPRQHIWTFAAALDVATANSNPNSRCTCTYPSRPNPAPSFVGDDYFCETAWCAWVARECLSC